MPDSGLFEKIEHRLRVRRFARIGAAVLVVAAVAGVAVALYPKQQSTIEQQPRQVAMVEPQTEEPQAMTAETQQSTVEPVAKEQGEVVTAVVTPVPDVNREDVVFDCIFGAPVAEEEERIVEKREPVSVPVMKTEPVEEKDVAEVENIPNEKSGNNNQETLHYDNLLWAPNAIAPAADDERNRVFKVVATSEVSHFYLTIFNRGGRQVFATDDINEAWDATLGGAPLSQGTYVWVAKFRDADGVLRQEKGTVTVIR